VMIVGMEEGVLPHSRSLEIPKRWKRSGGCVTWDDAGQAPPVLELCVPANVWGNSDVREPSRFLADIPRQLIEGGPHPPRQPRRVIRRRARDAVGAGAAAPQRKPRELQFQPGQRVQHSKFGEGIVIQSRADGSDEEVTIAFKKSGIKHMLASFANLEKLPG